MAMLDEIKAAVHQTTTIKASVKTLVTGLAQKLKDFASQGEVDPADLQALAAELEADNADFGALVTANTVADPAQAAATGGATSSAQAPMTPPPAPAPPPESDATVTKDEPSAADTSSVQS